MHTNESNFYKAGLWDGVMNSIEVAYGKGLSRPSLYKYAKKIAPEILQSDADAFIEKYFPVEFAKEHWVSPNAVPESDRARIGELFLQTDGQEVESTGSHLGFDWVVCKLGHRRAYVRIMPGHPWHGREHFQDLEWEWRPFLLTFSQPHVPDDFWVIGFFKEWEISLQEMEEDVRDLCKAAFDADQ